jgi:hypothetical protein
MAQTKRSARVAAAVAAVAVPKFNHLNMSIQRSLAKMMPAFE